MANYSLVINSKFRPFEYQELLAPVLAAEQAHQAVEDQYADLALKANIWDRLTNPETDQRAHSIYSAYATDLERQADELARNGLNPSSRQQMLNMRARYAKDITPIEAAYKRREEQIAEQRKLGTKMIYDFDAATTSLDRYLDNPSLSYNSIDRSDLYTRSVTDFSHYAKALADYGNGKKLDNFTNTFIQNYGISKDEARKFITDMRMGKIDEANPTLRAVYDALYNSTGVSRWNSPIAQERVKETILEGVGAAIGATKLSTYEDKGAVMARQLANSKALARYQQQLANEAAEAQRLRMYDVNPTTYYSASEIAAANKPIATGFETYRGKGYLNSDGSLTDRGRQMLSMSHQYQSTGQDRIPVRMGDSQFINWIRSINPSLISNAQPLVLPEGVIGNGRRLSASEIRNILNDGAAHAPLTRSLQTMPSILSAADRREGDRISAALAEAYSNVSSGKMASGTANFQVYRQRLQNKEDRDLVASEISAVLGEEGTIHRAGQLRNNTISEGEGLSASDFISKVEKNPILHIINSPTTGENGQQLVELTNGEKFLLPVGIIGNDTQANLNAVNNAIRNAGSTAELTTNLNRANSYVASILTSTAGTEIKPNDGTVTITW